MVSAAHEGKPYLGARWLLKAEVVDISEGGIGIRTRFPLEPAQTLMFTEEQTPHRTGIVRWARMEENDAICRAGVQFI